MYNIPGVNKRAWLLLGGLTPCVVGSTVIQINGVDMTEARHDQAVALLTGTSPTIALLVERDPNAPGGSPGQSRARAHSPPPPEPSDSPDQDEEGLHGNHLSQMEDEYPIEVRASESSLWGCDVNGALLVVISACCGSLVKALRR